MVHRLANGDVASLVAERNERAYASVEEVHRRTGVAAAALERLAQADGVVRSWVTREAGLTALGRMIAPSRFQRWGEYGSRRWRSREAARA
jgi:hypothetical protein